MYFSKITQNYWTAKNKAHKDILSMVKNYDQVLIKKEDVKRFIENIEANIIAINAIHRRCNDYTLDVYKTTDNNNIILRMSGVFIMYIYKVRFEFDKVI